MKLLIKKWVGLLVGVVPKRRYCYMKGLPSFDDSLIAVYEALPEGRFEKVIWSTYEEVQSVPFEVQDGTIFVRKGSWRDYWYGIISEMVFTTHGHFIPKIPENQTCVNVWHGMPFKAIGLLDGRSGREDSLVCSTSELYQDILSRAFGIELDRVLTTGCPRNDYLMADKSEEVLRRAGIDRKKFKKIFMWLPTYRKSVVGDCHEDGVEVDNVFNMRDFPQEEFEQFLKQRDCLCILKPHPMAPRKGMVSSEHILVIDEKWLWDRKLMLYPLLGHMDFLVSDISSVMVDFALLDRPMIVCFEDAKAYKESRNIIFDPLDEWLPGEIVGDYSGLTRAIAGCVDGQDVEREKRQRLTMKFHRHVDGRSTERLMKLVFGDCPRSSK